MYTSKLGLQFLLYTMIIFDNLYLVSFIFKSCNSAIKTQFDFKYKFNLHLIYIFCTFSHQALCN